MASATPMIVDSPDLPIQDLSLGPSKTKQCYVDKTVGLSSEYIGYMLGGKRHGQGTLTWSDGSELQGEWENDLPLHGKLIYRGGVYNGEFKNRQFHGQGVLVKTSGVKLQGEWDMGKLEGWGRLDWPSIDKYGRMFYEGNLVQGLRSGRGKMVWINGSYYEGEWLNGKRHGAGVNDWGNGTIYDGFFVNGKRSGLGKITYKTGDIWEGQWKDDRRDGPGKRITPWGRVTMERWDKGTLSKDNVPQSAQSLTVIIMEKIANNPELLQKTKKLLPGDLQHRVQTIVSYKPTDQSNLEHLKVWFSV